MNLDSEEIEKKMKDFEGTVIQLKTRLANLLPPGKTKDAVLDNHA